MPAPTRAEIVADSTLPTFALEVYSGGSWVDLAPYVVSVQPAVEATGGEPTGVAMGPDVRPEMRLSLFGDTAGAFQTLRAYETARLPVRVRFGFVSSDKVTQFSGVLMEWGGDDVERQWVCRGWDALIEAVEYRSPLLRRRPVATVTTLVSNETAAGGAGLINLILWAAGGRPLAQAATYPSAVFYYACTQALIAPEFSWSPGENPWEVCRRLCRAAGGQVYQDGAGVVRYVDPITLATGTPVFTFSDEVLTAAQRASQGKAPWEAISDRHDSNIAVTGVTVNYVTRLIQGGQVVYEDTVPRQVAGGAALEVTCDTQLPLYTLIGAEVDAAVIRTATAATPTVSATLDSAQRVVVTITNGASDPIMVDAIRVTGRPVAAGEEGSASYIASGARVVMAEDSPYVQSARHAEMLARMIYDGANNAGTIYTLDGCGYDPDRYVGEVVGLTSSRYGLSALRCRIVSIDVQDGAWMQVGLAPLGGLPTSDGVHLIGSVSGTKELAY